jgi:hypothetical protein
VVEIRNGETPGDEVAVIRGDDGETKLVHVGQLQKVR